jgi:SAM-dependent methyltransferase
MEFARLERDAWTDPHVAGTYASLWHDFVAPAIPPLLAAAGVSAGDRVLDLACGPGAVSREVARHGATPIALDFSHAMLRAAGYGPERVLADAARLPLRRSSVDRVVCNLGLLHFPNPEASLAESARVVRPGGVAAFSVWGPDATALTLVPQAMSALGLTPPLPAAPGFFRYADPSVSDAALRSAGLTPLPLEKVAYRGYVGSPTAFWRMVHEGTARTRFAITRLTDAEQERLRAEVEQRVDALRDGPEYTLPATIVLLRGRRA